MNAKDLIFEQAGDQGLRLLFIEPYMVDSHRSLVSGLLKHVPAQWTVLGLPGRFFRWRMRTGASYLAHMAGDVLSQDWDGLLCSSMLNLAELRGLVPSLAQTPALVYFHENQLAYPSPGQADQQQQQRDLFLAYSNLTTAQCAKKVVFNSGYHRDQFLQAARGLIAKAPDARPKGLVQDIAARCSVMPVPFDGPEDVGSLRGEHSGPLRIVWNHRWEHDKGPENFFDALFALADEDTDFQVAVLGRHFARWPEVFDLAPARLGKHLVHLGWAETREEYWRWLAWADVAVSTAHQEYQGLSVAEATWAGCRPLVPDRLVYPELYEDEYRYEPGTLRQALMPMIHNPAQTRQGAAHEMAQPMTWAERAADWRELIEELTHAG